MPPRRRHRPHREVKDRLIQTRVSEELESVLKEEAQKRRLTVSHLIRNVLEDTLKLVDTVVGGAGGIVGDSVELAEHVVRDAGKIASSAREVVRSRREGAPPAESAAQAARAHREPPPAHASAPTPRGSRPARAATVNLDHVLAWNQVVVNRPARCASCQTELPRGSSAHLGVTQDPGKPPCWLCDVCLARL